MFEFFDQNLPLEWEIYAQPHLNGLKPNFVLLNPAVGIAVFEVKDWDFDAISYTMHSKTDPPQLRGQLGQGPMFARENPLDKARLYQVEISQLYCPGLDRPGGIAAVTAGAIFPSAAQHRLEALFNPLGQQTTSEAARRYIRLIGRDVLESADVEAALPEVARRSSSLMSQELADDLRHWLVEPDFAAEQRRRPVLDSRQRVVVETRTDTGYRRVRGSAGSGKTLALAGRAAQLEQEGKDVLVIAYNVTLLNFLRDATVRFGADARRITWLNFHAWCKRTLVQLGRDSEYRALFQGGEGQTDNGSSVILDDALPALVGEALAAAGPSGVPIYDAVLVDEGQDMLPSWWTPSGEL